MPMLVNHHMELLNSAELAPETMFVGGNVAQNTRKKTKNNVSEWCKYKKKLMYIQMFIVSHSKYKYIYVVQLKE